MPKVSVIIPVYNVEKYLSETLECLVNQTLSDIEIICVDDGSTDDSMSILQEYAERDSRVKYLQQQNQYAGIARNNGLKIATGDYVIFLDSDDIFDKTMLEKLVNQAEKTNADVTVCRCQWLMMKYGEIKDFPHSIEKKYLPEEEVFSSSDISLDILRTFIGWPWDKLYRREFIFANGLEFQDLRHSNDTYFVLMSLLLANRISIVEDVLVTYRIHNTSLANTRTKSPACFYFALKALKSGMEHFNIFEKYEQSFINYCLEFSLWHIKSMGDRVAKRKMIDYFTELLTELQFYKYDKNYFYKLEQYKKAKKYYVLRKLFSIKNLCAFKVVSILGLRFKIK